MPRDPRALLFDILEAGQRVGRFVAGRGYDDYVGDELLRAGVERQFEIMGEALTRLKRLDPMMQSGIREHERIVAFRNVLIHGYAEIDDAVVWSVLADKLPHLLEDAQRLLDASSQT